MLTNEHLREQASALARQANELATFLKSDPELPPLDLAAGACDLDKIKVKLQQITTSLKSAATDESAGE